MSNSYPGTGLPAFDGTSENEEYVEGTQNADQILQITFAQNEDDASLTDVFFAGDNLDATDDSEVLTALLFAIKAVEPDNDFILQQLEVMDQINGQ